MRPDQVKIIARRLGVTETDVIYVNRRLGGDVSLNMPIRDDEDSGERQDWLVDERENQETTLAESEEFDNRRKALAAALLVLNDRAGSPRTRSRSRNSLRSSASRASACARSASVPSRR